MKKIEKVIRELDRMQAQCSSELPHNNDGIPVANNYPDAVVAGKQIAYGVAVAILRREFGLDE
jgi:hypothetical protein